MDLDIRLYRGEKREYYGEAEFSGTLRKAAIQHFGDQAKRGQIQMDLNEPQDFQAYVGPPDVRNLGIRGHCKVRLIDDGQTIEEKEFRVTEFLGPVLVGELRDLEPAEAQWGFILVRRRHMIALLALDPLGLRGNHGLIRDLERPAPEIKGTVEVDLADRRHRPFTLTPMADAAAERVSPGDLGLEAGRLDRLNILMSAEIRDQFLHGIPLSDRMEEGGFLLGRVHEAAPDTHLVEVTHVTPAHNSGAGPVHFTFTGESFLAVPQIIADRGLDEDLVGWYHTHIYGIDIEMGLSSVDVDLHLTTFQRPWQVAALLNLRGDRRKLRFYGRGGDGLTEYGQWIADDSGRYRPAGNAVGDE
jgi:proteasome lid subunit RPN8/RPN11